MSITYSSLGDLAAGLRSLEDHRLPTRRRQTRRNLYADGLTRDEYLERYYAVRDIVRLYLERREKVRRDVRAAALARDEQPGTPKTLFPSISDLHCWVIDVERIFRRVGRRGSFLVLHRMRKNPISWEVLEDRLGIAAIDAKSSMRAATNLFWSELRRKGLTTEYTGRT